MTERYLKKIFQPLMLKSLSKVEQDLFVKD